MSSHLDQHLESDFVCIKVNNNVICSSNSPYPIFSYLDVKWWLNKSACFMPLHFYRNTWNFQKNIRIHVHYRSAYINITEISRIQRWNIYWSSKKLLHSMQFLTNWFIRTGSSLQSRTRKNGLVSWYASVAESTSISDIIIVHIC